jgi:hypothetical protein
MAKFLTRPVRAWALLVQAVVQALRMQASGFPYNGGLPFNFAALP